MRRVVVGTAGHIDHGKTRLVEALTGIDCDRLREEKERGITIDLGFAHLRTSDARGEELQLSFVDVPGHERFVHNALAGLGGVRLMMLVVAADEGVKPQTREHLAICSLLGIPAAVAVLTKADLVSPELLELAQLELEDSLRGTSFEGAPMLAVSATTGAGIAELRAMLVEAAARAELERERLELPTRLPIDRAFHLKGMGAVVTGTLMSGRLRPGDTLELLPPGEEVRIRSVQVHGEDRQQAIAGERTSLQLTGVPLERLRRGQQLVSPGALGAGRSLLGRLRLLPEAPRPIRGFVPIRFHLTSSECVGKLRPLDIPELSPGESALVEIRLDQPVPAARGDRFVVRRPSPQSTLGGGTILDPRWLRRRARSLERALQALGGGEQDAARFWVESAGEAGIATEDIARRLGWPIERVHQLLAGLARVHQLLEVPARTGHGQRWLAPAVYRAVAERARRVLAEYFDSERMSHGMPKAEALRRILPGRGALLADTYLDWLSAQQILVPASDRIDLPGRHQQLEPEASRLADGILSAFDRGGLKPPSPAEIREHLKAKPQIFDGVLRYLITGKALVRLSGDLIVAQSALERLRSDLLASGWDTFGVPEFKGRYGLSRKWAIPLLEHLDQSRVTQRLGEKRRVLRPR